MTEIDLDAIRRRMDAATPGPWMHGTDGLVWPPRMGDPVSGSAHLADAAFIAHARQDVPVLLAEVDRLRAQLGEPCGSCHPCTNWADETWRRAGRKPPTVVEWDEACAELADLRPVVEAAKAWVRIRRDKSADGGTYHNAGRALAGAVDALAEQVS